MASILTNVNSQVALQTLRGINKNIGDITTEISTGKKIASAADNAAIWAVSTVIESDVGGFEKIGESLNLGKSTVAVARSASEQVTGLLQEIKGLVVAAQEDNVDREKIQTDIGNLRNQITSIVDAAQFNGLSLVKGTGDIDVLASLDRSTSGVEASTITVSRQNLEVTAEVFGSGGNVTNVTNADSNSGAIANATTQTSTFTAASYTAAEGDGYEIAVGTETFQYVLADGEDVNDAVTNLAAQINDAGLTGITAAAGTITDPTTGAATVAITNNSGLSVNFASDTQSGGTNGGGLSELAGLDVDTTDATVLSDALDDIETLIQTGIDAAAAFGSSERRIEIQNEFVTNLVDSLNTGIGALRDSDLEAASARLQSLQVQQQLGIQALGIANSQPQNILSLFR